MEKTSWKEKIIIIFAVGGGMFILMFIISCVWIGYEIKDICQVAQGKNKGEAPIPFPKGPGASAKIDCVKELVMFVDDKSNSFRLRNSAIWALGQLGDSRALSVLQKHYTGSIPSREPLDKNISQYELKKAINLASGGFNITKFVWKNTLY